MYWKVQGGVTSSSGLLCHSECGGIVAAALVLSLGPAGCTCDSKHGEFGITLPGLMIFVFPGNLLIFNSSRNEFIFTLQENI